MSRIYHNRFFAMGTRFHLLMAGTDEDVGFRIYQRIKNEVNRIEKKLSRFVPASDISRLNVAAFEYPAMVDDELFDVLKACKFCWEITAGAFDPTLRPLMEFQKNNGNFSPTDERFSRLKESLGLHHIQFDDERKTVRFDNDFIEIDLGGFGKGYALEKVKDILEKSPARSAFISFGESSIYAHGNHPAGDAWKIGINDYFTPGKSIHEFRVSNGSVSTSSNFYVDDAGSLRKHGHIINPFTGIVDEGMITVSVSAASPVLAEMLSTAFLSLGDEKIYEVINQYENLEVIKTDYSSGEAVVTRYDHSQQFEEIPF